MSVDPATTQDNALPLNYRLGEYLVRKVLGRGGFGFTYLAQDTKLGAEVAIKEYFPQSFAARQPNQTIAPFTSGASGGIDDYRWGLEQFLKEARALAKFKHNNIVRVLRFMEANGTAYMVMEYEAGQSLSDYLRTHGGFLAEPLLLKIFLPILNGLQAVHEAGLLHLDIKPGNIYLRRDGRPLLIDFGSARQVRAGAKTAHQTALTPGYCAPEQYPGRGELGAAADIYSIGATLYRCVTGKPPIDALQRLQTYERSRVDPLMPASKFDRPKYSAPIRATIDAALRLTALDRPRAAAALQNGLMGKGMEEPKKAEAGAYGSGFIGIIRTAAVRTKRRIYRSPMEKTLALLVFVATMMVVIPKILIDTGYLTKETLFNTIDTTVAQVAALGPAAKRWVDEQITGRPALDTPTPVASPPRRSAPAPAAPKIPPFAPQKRTAATLDMQGVAVTGVALLQDNKLIAAAGSDGSVRIWRRDGGELVHARTDRTTTPVVLAASADGRWLVLTGKDNSIELWDAQTEKPAGTLPGHSAEISALAFSLDGKYLVSAALDKTVSLWHVGERRRVRQLVEDARADVRALAFAPNGRVLAAADTLGGIRYWTTTEFNELSYVLAADDAVTALAFSPDSKWVATASSGYPIKLMRQGIDREDRLLEGAPDTVHALAFSPDGHWLIVAGLNHDLLLWDLRTGTLAERWSGHNHDVLALAISADGEWLVSGGDDHTVRTWR